MIRVLHVVSSLSKGSGVMSFIMNYYRHIEREEIQFDFCYFVDKSETYEEEILSLGGNLHRIMTPSITPAFRNQLRRLFRKNVGVYTALHIHEVYLTFLFAPVAREYGIVNIISHSHNTRYSDKRISALRNWIVCRRLKNHANHFFACSRAAGEFLYGRKDCDKGKVIIIKNAIDCEKFRFNESIRNDTRQEMGLVGDFVVGHIGRFVEQKNHDFLIDVFEALRAQKDNAKLVLIGDGPLMPPIREKVEGLGLENRVLFLGPRNDVPRLLQAMDVFVLPSLFEGLPVVGVEAQAAGLPTVFSKSITREIGIVNTSYISLNESSEFWAKKILTMDGHVDRPNAYEAVIGGGFDISREAGKLEALYSAM